MYSMFIHWKNWLRRYDLVHEETYGVVTYPKLYIRCKDEQQKQRIIDALKYSAPPSMQRDVLVGIDGSATLYGMPFEITVGPPK